MTRTLADMTPEERASCIGMWCDLETNKGTQQVVLYRMIEDHETGPVAYRLSFTSWHVVLGFDPEKLTPRFDLMRAWNPDCTPVKGEWAEGHMWWGEDTDTMETVDVVGAECLATGQIQGFDEWPDGVTPGEDVPVRRFITEWEATDE